jgi:hypothetical protein
MSSAASSAVNSSLCINIAPKSASVVTNEPVASRSANATGGPLSQ